jgi:hypothetical protein
MFSKVFELNERSFIKNMDHIHRLFQNIKSVSKRTPLLIASPIDPSGKLSDIFDEMDEMGEKWQDYVTKKDCKRDNGQA